MNNLKQIFEYEKEALKRAQDFSVTYFDIEIFVVYAELNYYSLMGWFHSLLS
jgi:hypothetical protein